MSEIVMLCGFPAAGKSTFVKQFVDKGYHRLNRDLLGGKLDSLVGHIRQGVEAGITNFVLDNTYMNKKARLPVLTLGQELGIPVRCLWLQTEFADAQLNACLRQVQKHGRLLTVEELAKSKDPNDFPPVTLFNYKKEFQRPDHQEGFSSIEEIPFVRSYGPAWTNAALLLDYDDTLRVSTGSERFPCQPSEVQLLPGRRERIEAYVKEHKIKLILGISNQSGIAKGKLTAEQAKACFDRTNELLGLKIQVFFCPHNLPPVRCFCRKPHCGLGALVIVKYDLDPRKCLFVGDQTTDCTFAKRCGFSFAYADEFFS